MKKIGVLHGELSKVLGEMAHHDTILIGDAGMPVPKGVQLIDLALIKGVPGFIETLKAIMTELHIEQGIIDVEMKEISPEMRKRFLEIRTKGERIELFSDKNITIIICRHCGLRYLYSTNS